MSDPFAREGARPTDRARRLCQRPNASAFVGVAFVASVAFSALTACGPRPPPTAAKTPVVAPLTVDGARARQLVAEGARLVDVRTPEEFATEHLDGAINVPVDTLGTPMAVDLGAKDLPLVLYCATGRRAAHAAELLRAEGRTRVYELGAMSRWPR